MNRKFTISCARIFILTLMVIMTSLIAFDTSVTKRNPAVKLPAGSSPAPEVEGPPEAPSYVWWNEATLSEPKSAHASRPEAPRSLSGEAAIKQLRQQGAYDPVSKAVAATEYAIGPVHSSAMPNTGVVYQAVNRAQELRTYFTGDEVRVVSTSKQQWQIGLKLKGYGYGDNLAGVTSVEPKAQGNRVEYIRYQQVLTGSQEEHSAIRNPQSAIVEWYENAADGLEQGFTLSTRPDSAGTEASQDAAALGPMRITLELVHLWETRRRDVSPCGRQPANESN